MTTFDGLTQEQRDIRRAQSVLKALMRAAGKSFNDELTIVLTQANAMISARWENDIRLTDMRDAARRCAEAAKTLLEAAREESVIR